MASYQLYQFRQGSANWRAFYNGQMNMKQLLDREIHTPIAEEIRLEMDGIGKTVEGLLDDTTDGWTQRPKFIVQVTEIKDPASSRITMGTYATGAGADNWHRINRGTVKHTITPGTKTPGAKFLAVKNYVRHTSVGTGLPKSNPAGGYHRAQPVRKAKSVQQSIRARHFDDRIVQFLSGDHDRSFSRRITNAIKRAKRRIEK